MDSRQANMHSPGFIIVLISPAVAFYIAAWPKRHHVTPFWARHAGYHHDACLVWRGV